MIWGLLVHSKERQGGISAFQCRFARLTIHTKDNTRTTDERMSVQMKRILFGDGVSSRSNRSKAVCQGHSGKPHTRARELHMENLEERALLSVSPLGDCQDVAAAYSDFQIAENAIFIEVTELHDGVLHLVFAGGSPSCHCSIFFPPVQRILGGPHEKSGGSRLRQSS